MAEMPPQRAADAAGPGEAAAADSLPAVVVHPPLPPRWPRFGTVALASSVALHAGLILAIWSRPSPPAESLALQSGRASVTLQMSLPSIAAPEPMSVGPMSVELTATDPETPERQRLDETRPPRPAPELEELGDIVSPSSPNLDSVRSPRPSESQARSARQRISPSPAPMPTATPRRLKRPRRALSPPSTSSPRLAAVSDPGVERETPEPLTSNRPPVYPAEAVAARAEGTARLRVTVSDEGAVVALEVQQSSGWSVLDQAALSAVATWRFRPQPEPARGGKQAVIIPVVFQLDR